MFNMILPDGKDVSLRGLSWQGDIDLRKFCPKEQAVQILNRLHGDRAILLGSWPALVADDAHETLWNARLHIQGSQ